MRLLIPFPAGGSTEFTALTLAGPMGRLLGEPVVVEARVGDAGIVALRELAHATAPTLMVGSVNTNSIAPVVFAERIDFDYDSRRAAGGSTRRVPQRRGHAPRGPRRDAAGVRRARAAAVGTDPQRHRLDRQLSGHRRRPPGPGRGHRGGEPGPRRRRAGPARRPGGRRGRPALPQRADGQHGDRRGHHPAPRSDRTAAARPLAGRPDHGRERLLRHRDHALARALRVGRYGAGAPCGRCTTPRSTRWARPPCATPSATPARG